MFRYFTTIKTFFFINIDEVKHYSVKELYILYKILFNMGLIKYDFKTFCMYNSLTLGVCCKFLPCGVDCIFLTLFFFLRTKPVMFSKKLSINSSTCSKYSVFRSNNTSLDFVGLDTFWKKWKDLKRPKTEDNFNEYFLNDWKSKFSVYSKIGFLKTYYDFFSICANNGKFFKNVVTVNKTLLVSPSYSSSSINKHISITESKNFEFQFLRKNKVYNKGRYSRVRQNYRTGVYMCMYLSVVSIFGLYYWFYKFSFNFTYLWWLFIAFLGSFFLPKIFKYRLYEPNTLLNKFFDFFRWSSLIIGSLFF